MDNSITTVLGEVGSDQLGITDAHSHLWISQQESAIEGAPVLDREDLIAAELREYRTSGGQSQLDCQTGGAGRDGNVLASLSKASGVHLIACTGFHLERYYPAHNEIWSMSADQAAKHFLNEVDKGLEETRAIGPVYPGFIKIAALESLEKTPRQLMDAALMVSKKTGLMIEMHTEKGSGVEDLLPYISRQSFPPDRLVICHIDKRPDPGLHKELCQSGYLLEYDTFFRPKYNPEENLWPLLREMVRSGFSNSIALATDQAESSTWNSMGTGPGLAGFPTIIKERLEEEFQDPKIVEALMGGNIAKRLIRTEGE